MKNMEIKLYVHRPIQSILEYHKVNILKNNNLRIYYYVHMTLPFSIPINNHHNLQNKFSYNYAHKYGSFDITINNYVCTSPFDNK